MPPTILVAEADEDIRNAVGWLLSSRCFRVLTVQDVPSALWAMEREAIDLAIVDVELVGADGGCISDAMGRADAVILLSDASGAAAPAGAVLRTSISRLAMVVRAVLEVSEGAAPPRAGASPTATAAIFPKLAPQRAGGQAVALRS